MFLALVAGVWAGSEIAEERPTLDVTGVGEVWTAPNEAVLALGVRAEAETADGAYDAAAERAAAVVQAIGRQVSEERIGTRRLSLEPKFEYTSGRSKLVGYVAFTMLEIRVDEPDAVGSVLDAAVAAGANDAVGVSWVVEDDDAVAREALAAAVADARANAELVAADLGMRLGDPLDVTVRDQGGGIPPVLYERGMTMADEGVGMPVLAGEQIWRAEVYVRFSLESADGGVPAYRLD